MNSVKRFAADEQGGLSNLMLPMFLLLVLTTGWSIDLILHETERADLQDSLDRGVLAAASVSQSLDRETVIQEYVDKRPFGRSLEEDQESNLNLRPDVYLPPDGNLNSTELSAIEAHAVYDFPTVFANIVFHDTYPVPAIATAEEGINHVEISLVLDISASMAQNDQSDPNTGTVRPRLEILQDAAKLFVSELLNGGTRQRVSISLIPYSGSVNPGILYDDLAISDNGDLSRCLDFQDADFTYAGLPIAQSLPQVPNFNYFVYTGDFEQDDVTYDGPDNNTWGWCPSSPIVPVTRDLDRLTTAIDGFTGHDGTGTNIAMKYGLALLDPTTRPVIAGLSTDASNGIPSEFAERPFAYDAPGVRKIIVLLTDGNIRFQPRPNPDQLVDENLLNKWGVPGGDGQDLDYDARYYSPYGAYFPGNIMALGNNRDDVVIGGNSLRDLTGTQQTNIMNTDEALRTSQFDGLCRLAHSQNNMRIFTIAFDVAADSDAYREMNKCASPDPDFDPTGSQAPDFFHVTNGNLQSVLNEIKNLVLSLRLTK